MAKQGMSRPERTHTQPHNDAPPVPELQGKAKHTKKKANPIVAGTSGPTMLVYHERPIPVDAYPELDTDLARDNLENDLPAADLEDLYSTVFGRGGSTVEPDKSVTMYATVCRSCASQLLVCDHCTNQAVVVHAGNALCFCPGCQVCIHYNGVMTHSIPPQISATCIHAMG